MRHRLIELSLFLLAPLAIFVTSPLLAQGLGVTDRGELGVIQSIASFAAAFGALGQAEVFLADLRTGTANLSVASRVAMTGGVLAAGVALPVAMALGVDPLVALVALCFVPVINQSQIWRGLAVSRHKLRLNAAANGLAAVLRAGLIAGLFAVGALTVASAIGSIQFALAIGAVATIGWSAWRWRRGLKSERPSMRELTDSLRRGSPMLVFTLLTTVTLRSDVLMLDALSTSSELGIYAAAASLSMAVLSISGAFKSRAQAALFGEDPRKAVGRELLILLVFGMVGALIAVITAPYLVTLLLGPGYESAASLLRVLAFGSVALMFLDVGHGLLAAVGARGRLLLTAAVGAGCTVLTLSVLLTWGYGAEGAAWASLVSYSVASVAGLLLFNGALRTSEGR
ncbi:lipopolysaccharide biosynthesis protein [Microbacterium fluvii]|uniref:Lipopolysaccharide biosynthesis protein n=1 Tax=Microbacterium fluvii TaxID=415215 RepID=A0ABW2HAV5_9MICO|nr:oligosaccharide flippase family protein [Microbacterium fluvii]MCU4671198.1 oligosaccharide flippase family protein [Microbacterium fluvii]